MGRFGMQLSLLLLFIVALASQVVLFFVHWVMVVGPSFVLTWSALAISGVCVSLMGMLAVTARDGGTRWLAMGLIGVVALAFSTVTIVSIGILTAPFALALVVASTVMLIRNRRSAPS